MRLQESITATNSRIDLDRGVVRGVKILGFHSENGYEYTAGAMKRAVPLYEGIAVNVDHPDRNRLREPRSYADRFGRLKNVRFIEGSGLVGDLHYNRQHPIASQFEYDVEHSPENLGLSHNASGSTGKRNGRLFVEEITTVRSVDLVADPATTVSLFESRNERRRLASWGLDDWYDRWDDDDDEEEVGDVMLSECGLEINEDEYEIGEVEADPDDEEELSLEELGLEINDDDDDEWDDDPDAHDGDPLEQYGLEINDDDDEEFE